VTWLKNAESALAYLEYLVYNCGYTQADLNTYFSDGILKKSFSATTRTYNEKPNAPTMRLNSLSTNLPPSGKQRIITFALGKIG